MAICSFTVHSQTYEIGAMIGGANYIGDVGKTNYINPNTISYGGILKWNRSARHSFRATALIANIQGDDSESDETRRQQRGYSFESKIYELSLGIEYTFWDFSMYDGQSAAAPYMYTGITYFASDALYKDIKTKEFVDYGTNTEFAIPIVLGFKTSVGTNTVAGFEIGARYTLTDALDGSGPDKGIYKGNIDYQFGNLDSNDWYVFTGVTFTFTFGRKPCYCNF